MKFNDDSLMLFDLDNSCLDYGAYDTIDSDYSNQFVDFACEDLEHQFSSLNTIKTCTLIDEIDLFSNAAAAGDEADFSAEFCDFTDSLFGSNSNLNLSNNLSNHHNSSSSPSQSSPLTASPLSNASPGDLPADRSSDASSFDFHSSFSSSSRSPASSAIEAANRQDKREVKKKLLDLTQRKLTHTLCFDSKLRNQVLLKSALKSVNSLDEDNLLGTERRLDSGDKFDSFADKSSKQDKSDKMDEFAGNKQDAFGKQEVLGREKLIKLERLQQGKQPADDLMCSPSPRKRNFKSNSLQLFNDQEMMFEERTKKQKLSHLHSDGPEECFIDENTFNDDLALSNLANCFIKLRTQHSHD